jgi:hypothetical protein
MAGSWIGSVPDSLALVARQGKWWRLSWRFAPPRTRRRPARRASAEDRAQRFDQFRYHLGRGRRAREAGRFEQGAAAARRAIALDPSDPWALALLGQCLQRQHASDLAGARQALERAWSLDQSNGYFVGLLLDVLRAQGDTEAASNLLNWAWWHGAPVERWLPGGPPMPKTERRAATGKPAAASTHSAPAPAPTPRRVTNPGPGLTGRQPIPA